MTRPPQEVGVALADLERLLHAEDDTPFLVKVGLAHAQFETIHPFLDGNGRVGRLLITLLLREEDRTRITDGIVRVAGNGLKVPERLYHRPVISVKEVQEMIGTTYPAANDLVSRLEALGILREITGWARNRRYMYDRYVQLFADGGR
jgi:Fic family protein